MMKVLNNAVLSHFVLSRPDLRKSYIAVAVMTVLQGGLYGNLAYAAEKASSTAAVPDCQHHQNGQPCTLAPIVITASAPDAGQAYLIKANPKQPIQPVPATDGADYLKHIAGFNAIRNGGTNGDPVFRGMFGSRLKILNNGAEMLGACPARMDAPTSYISPQNFDEITVVKGPQSVIWGAASAATVNFARQPEHFDETSIKAQGSVMAASNHRVDSDVETLLGSALGAIRFNANTSESDDYKDGNGNKVPAKWRKWNADMSASYTPTDDTWLELSAGKGDGEARYAGRGMDGSQFLRESVGLRFEQNNLSDVLQKLEGQVNYNNANHIMDNFTLREPTAMDMGGHGHDTMNDMDHGMAMDHDMDMSMDPAMAMQLVRKTISGRLAVTLNWQDYELITGFDASQNDHKGRMGGQYTYKDATWNKDAGFNHIGVFGELSKPLDAQNKLISGLRLDRSRVKDYRSDEPSALQTRKETLPSAFVRLENQWPQQAINSYIGVGYVDRMPDYWELFSPVHAGDTNAFLGVDSEKTTQLDMGLTHQAGPWTNWASVYAGRINGYILMSYHHHEGHSGNTAGAKNVDATIAGAEAGTTYKFNNFMTADFSLAYAWGRNNTDKAPLPQIVPLDARLGLSYQQDQFSVGTLLRMVAPQNRIALNQGNIVGYDLGKSKGFAVFSVNAAYQINSLLNMSAGVDNLFDNAYREHLNKAGNSAFGYAATEQFNEMGRNFWVKLSVEY
ncbi:TonB-dependent copper receptor [Alkanindiges sp. WGS2144]|uniref:TonB-dependent copper receptor n=1 Tax=Alkanindiges sp. WGS2144 TaxID=3366808 RepID=UPI00375203B2